MAQRVHPPVYIDTNRDLARLAMRLLDQAAVAVDTEANSLFAYRERLCLIQISAAGRDYIVDPLAEIDLGILSPVFADPGITKIFHDGEFDVLMLRRAWPFEFSALFDTKVVTSALGHEHVGLAAVLDRHCGVKLDKRFQRSDWGRRPLSEGQIDYAALDTHYLIEVAEQLRPELHAAGEPLVLEVAAECRRLAALEPEQREFNPDEWVKLKGSDRLDALGRRALRELFVMRDGIARKQNQPPFKILPTEALLSLARTRPATRSEIQDTRGIPSKLATRYSADILKAMDGAASEGPLHDTPRLFRALDDLTSAERRAYERLRSWRKDYAAERGTDPALVLSRLTMIELSRVDPAPSSFQQFASLAFLEPWRVRHYGEEIYEALLGPGRRRQRN
jgi:ribonuclease D